MWGGVIVITFDRHGKSVRPTRARWAGIFDDPWKRLAFALYLLSLQGERREIAGKY